MNPQHPHLDTVEARLRDWDAKIESLAASAERAGEHVRADYQRGIEELKAQGDDSRQRLEEYKASGTETWEAFRAGLDSAWKDLETALQEIVRHKTGAR